MIVRFIFNMMGHGATQALQDGRVVAQWLDPSKTSKNKTRRLSKAVQSCVRELAQRTQKVVLVASRQASQFWHFPSTNNNTQQQERNEHFKFAGVPLEGPIEALLAKLDERIIRVCLYPDLDQAIVQVLLENDNATLLLKQNHEKLSDSNEADDTKEMDPKWVASVWETTQRSDLGCMRRLSFEGQRSSCFMGHA